jgi:hypothetical protein
MGNQFSIVPIAIGPSRSTAKRKFGHEAAKLPWTCWESLDLVATVCSNGTSLSFPRAPLGSRRRSVVGDLRAGTTNNTCVRLNEKEDFQCQPSLN